jgi:starvation-inducible DNA-binding protein
MMDIGLKDEQRSEVCLSLQKVLANQEVFYQKLRNFHWNVVGENFHSLHTTFENFYNDIATDIDEVAERIRSLGHKSTGTFTEFLQNSDIKETPGEYPDAMKMVKILVDDEETLIRSLRKARGTASEMDDTGTEDLLIGLMEKYEKQAWMLRSILE